MFGLGFWLPFFFSFRCGVPRREEEGRKEGRKEASLRKTKTGRKEKSPELKMDPEILGPVTRGMDE